MLRGKNILIGVCGSIAAYKIAILTRLLVKEGAHVKIIMTPSSTHFITPLTLSTLSKNPVLIDYFKEKTGEWNSHVELGLWADYFVIAPATANTLAKLSIGICDNLLTATYLSARCPVFIVPAMDLDMYQHPTTSENIARLKSFGCKVIYPEHGELASGLFGEGRMAEPEHILEFLVKEILEKSPLRSKRALITAGPTYESIDPVRFIGNHSSGKMGYAIAETMADMGAEVNLVSGPTQIQLNHPNIKLTRVSASEEMFEACDSIYGNSDITVLSAAVADYKPTKIAPQKIKKETAGLSIELEKTIDIAASLASKKRKGQFTVGFALETENELENAKKKLASKGFDMIVLNSLNDEGAGFGFDTNKIKILDTKGRVEEFELKTKKEVARDIVNSIINHLND